MFMQFIFVFLLKLTQKDLHKIEEIGSWIVMAKKMVG
jgi:hypothetical protein